MNIPKIFKKKKTFCWRKKIYYGKRKEKKTLVKKLKVQFNTGRYLFLYFIYTTKSFININKAKAISAKLLVLRINWKKRGKRNETERNRKTGRKNK